MGPLHSMKSINFSVAEKILTDWEGSCPSSLEQSSHVISSFLSWQILKAAKLRERVRSVSLLPNYSAHTTQWISTEQTPVSFNFYPLSIFQLDGYFPSVFQQIPPPATNIFQLRGAGTCYTLPNETQNHQPIQESQEPGQTHPNCLEFPRRWIGTRGLCWYQYASSL